MDPLEVVLVHVPTNVPPEVRTFLARVAKMEAGQSARQFDVPDRVAKATVLARWRRPRHPAIESEGDPIGSKERG